MPYKDKGKVRQYQQDWVRQKRGKGSTNLIITKEKAIKLLKIAASLDKEITGLQGRENMLDLVRYGNLSMREVGEAILQR